MLKYGIRCLCEKCGHIFILHSWESEKDKPCLLNTTILMKSCESDGIYAMYIHCPICSHKHELWV